MAATASSQHGNPQQQYETTHGYNTESPFRVLGIALVVDQRGKGANMVFRYPASPSTKGTDDLFFRLPPRQMAKLFRPKAALCGKPMTLSVGGTVFCCYAVLMDETQSTPASIPNNTSVRAADELLSDDGASIATAATTTTTFTTTTNNAASASSGSLLLFSVIVAVVPKHERSTMPITGWFERQYTREDTRSDYMPGIGTTSTKDQSSPRQNRRSSASFLSIRRVHISLARLCRVLEREEVRCQYVSVQTQRIHRIRNELKAAHERSRRISDNTTGVMTTQATLTTNTVTTNSPLSLAAKTAQPVTTGTTLRQHRRVRSFTLYERSAHETPPPVTTKRTTTPADNNSLQSRNVEPMKFHHTMAFQQVFLDTIMTTMAQGEDDSETTFHAGNLARELMLVYHALAQNDDGVIFAPSALISGNTNIVYINGHMGVSIETLSVPRDFIPYNVDEQERPVIKSYQTLLFPRISATELLESLSTTYSGPPRRLQQLLGHIDPRKSLTEISTEANLPLPVAMDIASLFIGQGLCITAPVLSGNSRLVCRRIDLVRSASLSFMQTFGDAVPVFHVVSYLTKDNRTLGNALVEWKTSEEDAWLRESLQDCLQDRGPPLFVNPDESLSEEDQNDRRLNVLEDLLFQMTVWLYSHKVLVQLLEYLVHSPLPERPPSIEDDDPSEVIIEEQKMDSTFLKFDRASNDTLYQELLSSGALYGKSLQECSWQTGVDINRLRAFALQHPRVRLMVRTPHDSES